MTEIHVVELCINTEVILCGHKFYTSEIGLFSVVESCPLLGVSVLGDSTVFTIKFLEQGLVNDRIREAVTVVEK